MNVTRTSIRYLLTSYAGRGRSDLIQIYVGYSRSIEPLSTITFLKPKRARLLLFFHQLRPEKISFLESWRHVIGQHSHQNDETTATCLWQALDESKSLDESDSGLVKLILGIKRVNQLNNFRRRLFSVSTTVFSAHVKLQFLEKFPSLSGNKFYVSSKMSEPIE